MLQALMSIYFSGQAAADWANHEVGFTLLDGAVAFGFALWADIEWRKK